MGRKSIKKFVEKLLDEYLDITDNYWSIEIQQRNGKYAYSIYKNNEFLAYEEPINESA